jgi:DNA-binding Lrp family transcriptional regulator
VQNRDGSLLTSYVLVTTEAGKTRTALVGIRRFEFPGCKVLTVEPVIGGPDIIAKIEALSIDSLARAICYGIQEVPGVLDVEVSLCSDRDDLPLQETSGRREPIDVVSVTNR